MSGTEQRRAQVLHRVLAGTCTRAQAVATLGCSERPLRRLLPPGAAWCRLLRAYEARGPVALVHGNRGRRPAHALPAAVRDRVLALARTTYAGCNDVHFSELLDEREGIAVSRATLRRWRRSGGGGGRRRRAAEAGGAAGHGGSGEPALPAAAQTPHAPGARG